MLINLLFIILKGLNQIAAFSTDLLTIILTVLLVQILTSNRNVFRHWPSLHLAILKFLALDIAKTFEKLVHAVPFQKLKSYRNSVIVYFVEFPNGSLFLSDLLMLRLLMAPLLLPLFPSYALMAFLKISFLILLSVLMTSLYILDVSTSLICCKNSD